MAKKVKEPEFIMSALNTPMLNYRTYVMSNQEKLMTSLLAFIVGGVIGLAFYGGQFRDANGIATIATQICDLVVFCLTGIVAVLIFFPMRKKQLKDKRRKELTGQFRSFLDALGVALSSGMNISEALISTSTDLETQYSKDAYIVAEVREMVNGIRNNVPIEDSLASFGERSEIEDVKNFATVFSICYRAGGNLKNIVRRTNYILSEKLEIGEEIETSLASNKAQFNAMMVIPVAMMLLLRGMSSSFAASFSTVAGVTAITIAIGLFVAAYKLGQKIMDIKG